MHRQPWGVVGAGTMGSGIAQKIAAEGIDVVLLDQTLDLVAKGRERIATTLEEGRARGLFDSAFAETVLGRVRPSADVADLAGCELVVEAVFEDLEVKRNVFSRLAQACPAEVLLATNTSSFLVADVQGGMRHPERILGLHYFYHPAKNRLVEVIGGPETGAAQLSRARDLQKKLGKTSIDSADRQGFVVNRFFVPWLNEAVRLLEVADMATIDAAACQAFKVGMGPFALMNATGVPIALHSANTLASVFGSFYEPAAALNEQVASGKPWKIEGEPADDAALKGRIAQRLLSAVFIAAGQLVDEKVGTIEDVDIGARVGLRWGEGPFELWNRYDGRTAMLPAVQGLAETYDVPVPAVLAARTAPFTFSYVEESRPRPGLALLTIRRPAALNALNPTVVTQLAAAFDRAATDDAVRTIAVTGAGKAFVSGADIDFFVDCLKKKDLAAIRDFTVRGQELLARMQACEKPVVALLDGVSLGGGSELALACHRIIGTPRASFGFPETGIGIYPGLGGTQRLAVRVGPGLAKDLVLTGRRVEAEEALAMGLLDRRVEPDALIDAALEVPGPRPPLPPALAERAQAFAGLTAAEVYGPGDPPAAIARDVGKVRAHKAKQAVLAALRLLDDGEALRRECGVAAGLKAGLAAEIEGLEAIFTTGDALEGLSSVLERRRPAFTGR